MWLLPLQWCACSPHAPQHTSCVGVEGKGTLQLAELPRNISLAGAGCRGWSGAISIQDRACAGSLLT